jgi:hypothetical protein
VIVCLTAGKFLLHLLACGIWLRQKQKVRMFDTDLVFREYGSCGSDSCYYDTRSGSHMSIVHSGEDALQSRMACPSGSIAGSVALKVYMRAAKRPDRLI